MVSLESFLTLLSPINNIESTNLSFNGLDDPEQIFSQLAEQPWAMWLDSCNSTHIDSRYDILVWQPIVTLTTKGNSSTIDLTGSQQSITLLDDPLALVNKLNQHLFKDCLLPNNDLPFKGGAVGYFSYDLGRRFEQLPSSAKQDIEQPDMAIGFYQQAIIYDRQNTQFYLLSPASLQAELIKQVQQLITKQLNQEAERCFHLSSAWQANMSQENYQEKFSQVKDYLLSGDCYQINLAQRFSASYQGCEFNAYQTLRHHNKAPFSAFIKLENSTVLSISPERFLQVTGEKVQTKPIKGTRPRQTEPQADQQQAEELQQATKDRAENLMIVDLLRNDLSKVCIPGSVKVPSLFAIESFPAVHHLVSTVEGDLSAEHSACDLLRGAFPGGSITGAPKIRAMEIIEELEPQRRNLYCGSIGYISACGNMDTSITIRTLICEKNKIYCWAGGGLVADSNVESEYQETYDKVNKILPILSAL